MTAGRRRNEPSTLPRRSSARVIEKGKGYAGPDLSSKMPSFNDSMTVQEAIDLVAYLRSLKPAPGTPAGHRGH